MEAERYVVRELEGYNIAQGAISSHARLSLAVCVLDSRLNYRLVREYKSEIDGRKGSRGNRNSWEAARELIRTQAAELAARLNEETP